MTAPSNGDNGDGKIDILIDQVGRLSEGITEFRLAMEQSTAEFRADMTAMRTEFRTEMAEIKASIREQNEISKRQAETADRLARVVETLVQRQGG